MDIEESPPYRMGFASDLYSAKWYFRELFLRLGLLPPKYETLFELFCRRASSPHTKPHTVKEWRRRWKNQCDNWDFSIKWQVDNWK